MPDMAFSQVIMVLQHHLPTMRLGTSPTTVWDSTFFISFFSRDHDDPSITFQHALALTLFADLTVEEYRSTYLRKLPPPPEYGTRNNYNNDNSDEYNFNQTVALPSSIDWTDLGVVAPIKQQELVVSIIWLLDISIYKYLLFI